MDEKPNYYAIIPASVRYDNNLTPSEKLFYGEITALTYKTGECWATNSYFANLYNVSTRSITSWIAHLEKNKYIQTETFYKDNSKEIEKRVIKIPIENNFYTYGNKFLEGYRKKELGGIEKNFQENNTSNNNTSINNIKENVKRKYYDNKDLNNIFIEYLDMRKKMKAINSDRAINTLINKLSAYDDDIKFRMIEQSIVNSWKSIYEIKLTKEEIKKQREKEIEEWLKEENNE